MDESNRKCASCPSVALPGRSECKECVDKRAARLKGRAEAKKARGECNKCPNPAVEGKTLCQECCNKNIEGHGKRRHDRRGIGLCTRCGKGARTGKTICSSCAKKENTAAIKKRAKLSEDCVCIQCGDEIETGFARCVKCLENQRASASRRKAEIIADGLCFRCKSADRVEGHNMCEVCIYKRASISHLNTGAYWGDLKKKLEQNGKCPYLGLPINVGVDAELDHRIPLAKGGTNDQENLQWVHVWANVMKADLTEEEFLAKFRKALPTMMETNNV